MRANKIIVLVLLVILLGQPLFIISTPVSQHEKPLGRVEAKRETIPSVSSKETLLRTNVIRNPSFEELDSDGRPQNYNSYGTAFQNASAQYDAQVHSGTYAGYVEGYATTMGSSFAYLSQNFNPGDVLINESLILDMYFYIKDANTLDQGSAFLIYFETTNSTNDYIYFYYVIGYGTYSQMNASGSVYFMMNHTIHTWHQFTRNLTADFYKSYTYLSADTSRYLVSIRVSVFIPIDVSVLSSLVVDDISIQNKTADELVVNGGFETGIFPWYRYQRSPAWMDMTSDCTDGDRALNISVISNGRGDYGYANVYIYNYGTSTQWYPAEAYSARVEFDWKYHDIYNGGGQIALFYVQLQNETGYYYLYYILGADLNQSSFSNQTNAIYLKAPNFGVRDKWTKFSVDLSQILIDVNYRNMSIYQLRFQLYLGSEDNSTVELLLDNLNFITYTFGDPGFEETYRDSIGTPIASWALAGTTSGISRSTDAHSGHYSANLTISNNHWLLVSRFDYAQINPKFFFDVSWKITSLTLAQTSSVIETVIDFEGGYHLHYLMAVHDPSTWTNSTSHAYYAVKSLNTTGTWLTLHRNITRDLNEALGPHQWNVTELSFHCYMVSTDESIVLVDDVGFVEETPPTIDSIELEPTQPVYHEDTIVTIQATDDLAGVKQVILHYRTSGSWITVEATRLDSHFTAVIPKQPYGQVVQYYIEAIDFCGNTVIDDNSGSYYSFTSGDDIAPVCSIGHPVSGMTIANDVIVNATAEDEGSGIVYVEFFVDGNVIFNDSSAPYEFVWNSHTVSNGTHTLTATAHDAAGMSTSDSITVNIQNDVRPPQLTSVILNPSTPQYTDDVMVYVSAIDVSGVKNVTLYYRTDGSWTAVTMTAEGMLYSAMIPKQPYGTTIYYYVVAYDIYDTSSSVGNRTYPLEYTVTDNIAPTLGVSGPPQGEPLSGVVTFQISATDDGSGIQRVDLRINGNIVTSTTGDQITLDTTTYSNGNYNLTFVAYDNAGNIVQYSMEYEIHNPVGAEVILSTLGSIVSQYGFVLGVAATIVVFVIINLLTKRRASK